MVTSTLAVGVAVVPILQEHDLPAESTQFAVVPPAIGVLLIWAVMPVHAPWPALR